MIDCPCRARLQLDTNDFQVERARLLLRGRREQVKHERKSIQTALKRLSRKRDADMEQIRAILEAMARDGKEALTLARRDDALAQLEADSDEAVIREMQERSKALAAEQADWGFGAGMTEDLRAAIDLVLKEARGRLQSESEVAGTSAEQLSFSLFKQQLCPLLSLALLETGRVQASIDLDDAEVRRVEVSMRTPAYDRLGKGNKARQVQLAWAGGEAGGRVGEGSVMSQHAYLGRVKDMLESIEAQSRPVWTRMGTLEEAVVVASRSPYELIMLSTGDTHSWQCILHPRALAKVLPSGYTPFDCFVDAV
jgi:hypothetical protein